MNERDDTQQRDDDFDWKETENRLESSAPDMPEGAMVEGSGSVEESEEMRRQLEALLHSSAPSTTSGAMSESIPEADLKRRIEEFMSSSAADGSSLSARSSYSSTGTRATDEPPGIFSRVLGPAFLLGVSFLLVHYGVDASMIVTLAAVIAIPWRAGAVFQITDSRGVAIFEILVIVAGLTFFVVLENIDLTIIANVGALTGIAVAFFLVCEVAYATLGLTK